MKLIIIGASGHGKVCADIAEKNGYTEIEFLDDNRSLQTCGKWPVVGCASDAAGVRNDLFVAIGNAATRKRLMESLPDRNWATLIHPDAVIADDVMIGDGTAVMAGVVINPGTKIGRGCIVNTCSSVDHDCIIGDYVHISVGAHLSGTVTVGEGTWISVGASVSNNVNICGDCTIGAGAVVVKNLEEEGTYTGVPAKIVMKTKNIRGVELLTK